MAVPSALPAGHHAYSRCRRERRPGSSAALPVAGNAPPLEWQAERRGKLQEAAVFRRIAKVLLTSPSGFVPGAALNEVMGASDCLLEEGAARTGASGL